jgi:hypothetical protein
VVNRFANIFYFALSISYLSSVAILTYFPAVPLSFFDAVVVVTCVIALLLTSVYVPD